MKNQTSLTHPKLREKAPKWTTYFSGSPKKMRVIYRIFFYSQNPKKTCYATLKKIAEDCHCSIDLVYQAIKIACEIGIIKKTLKTSVYQIHPITKKPLFNKNVLLTWLGDTPLTMGELCFGERTQRAFNSQNSLNNLVKNQGYIKRKELSKERREEKTFPLEEKIQESLKGYSPSLQKSILEILKVKYQYNPHFLPLDFEGHIKRFKEKNPLKTCYKCHRDHNNISSLCNLCFKIQKNSLEIIKSSLLQEIPPIEEIQTPKLKEIYLELEKRLKRSRE